jgi:hypothetical protein
MPPLDHVTLQANIRRTLDTATSEQRAEGKRWYQTAHTFAHGLSKRHKITVSQAAGIIAALSPQTPWSRNMAIADTFCRTGDAGTLRGSVRKARAIRAGADPLAVLKGPKTTAFYANILDPSGPEVTIDRHAADVACGVRRGRAYRPEIRMESGYHQVADAYRAVAAELGMRGNVVQAITWLAWR